MDTRHKVPSSFAGRPAVLIFDVNETLIDIESLSPLFERVFGDRRMMREWLGHLIMYSMTLTLSGFYKDFWSLGGGLLQMLGAIHKVKIDPTDIDALQKAMKTMPAHADSEPGLKLLQDAGFRMVTLTNSPPTPGSQSPLEHAGLHKYFERQFNIETARAYKPAPVVYHMVASHVWDTIGGQSAGMAGGLITRPGNALLPIPGLSQPHAVGADLPTLAREMIRLWRT